MTDVLTPEQRRRNMSAIRSKNTKPEMVVRSLIHRLGYRYRLHCRNLPGKPDIVFISRRKIVFVHGCYWHVHNCPAGQVVPRTNTEFWQTKRQGNVDRDLRHTKALETDGWSVKVIWECQTKNPTELEGTIIQFLEK